MMKRRDESEPPRRHPPPRRSRLRGLLKWTGTLACLLILLAAAACERWRRVACVAANGEMGVCDGGAYLYWWKHESDFFPLEIAIGPYGHHGIGQRGLVRGWPEARFVAGFNLIVVPLWMLFVLIGVPTAWLWWRDRRRVPAGGCAACGYDLTGNVSGRCPECGALREVGTPKSEV